MPGNSQELPRVATRHAKNVSCNEQPRAHSVVGEQISPANHYLGTTSFLQRAIHNRPVQCSPPNEMG